MSTFVDVYYQREWKQKCAISPSFVASWQGLAVSSHSMLIVFIPFYTFTAFCILKKTPNSMISVKFVLLNTHLWCSYVDILICSLITPFFYFPTISGFPVGLLRTLDVPTSAQIYLGVVSSLCMGLALIALFENRSSCISTNKFRMTKTRSRVVYYSIVLFIYTFYLLPAFLNIPDQVSAKIRLLDEIPCPSEEFFYSDVFVLTVDKYWKEYLWISTAIMVSSIVVQIAFFAICCVYHLFLSSAALISSRTRKYQRLFFLGTLTQALVPCAFLALPVASVVLCIYFEYYNQALNNIVVLVFSLHGFASTVVVLLVHHPYRSYLVRVITFDRSAGE